jgi:hypothetical protein
MLMTKIKGVLAGLALLLVLAVGLAFHMTPAVGQPAAPPDRPARAEPAPKAAEVGRYQISTYGFPTPAGGERGAYIIDTATGEVFHVVNDGKPASLGSVAKDKK